MMRIIVTGGMGFIGSNLIRYIISNYETCEVLNIDYMGIGSNPNNLKDLENCSRYRFIMGDICDRELMEKVIRHADAIINVAAETHVDRSIVDPWPFIYSNFLGAYNILEAIRKKNPKIRLIHVSTDEVYGDIIKGSFKEDDRLRPSNPYAATKASADMLCLAYHRTYGIDVIITRCTNNFGPYQFPEKLIPKTIIRALKNLQIPIYGKGENIRDWIYVEDHCEAICMILERGNSGEIYNISSGNELKNIELVKMILRIMEKNEDLISFVEDRPGHDVRYSLDSTNIRREIGWKPRNEFKKALIKTVEWYINNEWWWKPIADEKILHPTPWKIEK